MSAVAAGALLAVGLTVLPAESSPAATPRLADGVAAGIRDALPKPVHGLSPGLLDSNKFGRKTPGRRAPAAKDAQNRVSVYVEGDNEASLRAAVQAVGGTVTGKLPGLVRAQVAQSALADLAGRSGVTRVRQPDRAREEAVTSEGVTGSGADAWQGVGTGAGVKVGIVDAGFSGLSAAQAAGDLPATGPGSLTVQTTVGCPDVNVSEHGTAVTEIVHDMAPAAELVLVCVNDSVDLSQAADILLQQGVSVVNMSLGFPFAGRGDGTGQVGAIIQRSRQAGLLWSVSAGNEGQDHFRGKPRDANQDGVLEFSGTDAFNGFVVPPGGDYTIGLQWDAWPVTTSEMAIVLMSARRLPTSPDDPAIIDVIDFGQSDPELGAFDPIAFANEVNTGSAPLTVWPFIINVNVPASVTYDFSVLGTAGPLLYHNGGSISEPATSPYAMAVGAVCAGTGELEWFSSQGPTIDGRVKPDIAGFDGVSTTTFGSAAPGSCDSGFLGTSAAAPHVTGAAALVKSANPSFDASQIQTYLQEHATPSGTGNETGRGVLNMGPQEVPQAKRGSTFTPLATPTRILDTRTTNGGHPAPIAAREIMTLTIPGLPADATAVAINLTGTAPTVRTHLDVFPETFTGTSTLNLEANQTAAVYAMVALGPNHTIKIRNDGGSTHAVVDLLGTFVPDGGSTYVTKNPPVRWLDTRTVTGGHQAKLQQNETISLPVTAALGVPADATAVLINVTGVNQSIGTHLDVFSDTFNGTSTLNLNSLSPRANMTAVGLSNGQIKIHNSAGTINVVVDLLGYFVPNGGSRFVALDPMVRTLDTRFGNGLRLGPLGDHQAMSLQGSRINGVPYNATAVSFNLTAVQPTATETVLTAWPAGLPRPNTSNLNAPLNLITPNAVVVGVGTNGNVSLFNLSGNVNLVADLTGYFVP